MHIDAHIPKIKVYLRENTMQRLAISQITTRPLTLAQDINLCKRIGSALEASENVIMVNDLFSACRYAENIIAMKVGRIHAEGSPSTVVSAQLVRELYGVSCSLSYDPYTGAPIIVVATTGAGFIAEGPQL